MLSHIKNRKIYLLILKHLCGIHAEREVSINLERKIKELITNEKIKVKFRNGR